MRETLQNQNRSIQLVPEALETVANLQIQSIEVEMLLKQNLAYELENVKVCPVVLSDFVLIPDPTDRMIHFDC